MEIDDILRLVLRRPYARDRKHLVPQERTSPSHKPLEPLSQLHIIWKALTEYIHEKLLEGKGVNVRGFGAFTFEIKTDLPRATGNRFFNPMENINDQRRERHHLHQLRPCFVADPSYQANLYKFPGKDQLDRPASQHSIYQKGFSMIYCNAVPIAKACFLRKDVVVDALEAIFATIRSISSTRDYTLRFGFCTMRVFEQDLKVTFNPNFHTRVNDKNFETQLRKSDYPASSAWRTSYNKKWAGSTLNKIITVRPGSSDIRMLNDKTLALKLMSMDMTSKTKNSPQRMYKTFSGAGGKFYTMRGRTQSPQIRSFNPYQA